MKRTFLTSLVSLLAATFVGACVEETASDIPDQAGESDRRKGQVLEELVEVISLEEDALGSPFVDGIDSLLTFEEAVQIVKERPHFVSFDHKIEKRGVCPGLRTRSLEVNPWTDLGMTGKLTLTFYNGILGGARFGTGNLARYKAKSKAERGLLIRTVKRHRREPFTNVWVPVLPPHSPIFNDIRVEAMRTSISMACRYQQQIEDGLSEPPA